MPIWYTPKMSEVQRKVVNNKKKKPGSNPICQKLRPLNIAKYSQLETNSYYNMKDKKNSI